MSYTDPHYAAAYIAACCKRSVRDIILGKPDERDPAHVQAWETRREPSRTKARAMREELGL